MSYDIRLCDPVTGDVINLDHPHLMRGGTYAMAGTTELWLNVTYNYSNRLFAWISPHRESIGERRSSLRMEFLNRAIKCPPSNKNSFDSSVLIPTGTQLKSNATFMWTLMKRRMMWQEFLEVAAT